MASEQRLRDFLSDAAHELRTPLAGVQAAAEHLLRDDPPRAPAGADAGAAWCASRAGPAGWSTTC